MREDPISKNILLKLFSREKVVDYVGPLDRATSSRIKLRGTI